MIALRLFLLPLIPMLAAQDPPPGKCTLSGIVVNSVTGAPLNKVSIFIQRIEGDSAATVSDAAGRFTLSGLEPGRYQLGGRRNGYLDTHYGARRAGSSGTTIVLAAGQELKDLTLRLLPFGVIAGVVRDADGEPLAGAAVTVLKVPYRNGGREVQPIGAAKTDDLGQYRIPDLPAGSYYVRAVPPHSGEGFPMLDHPPEGESREELLFAALYPGTFDPAAAQRVEIAAGTHRAGVDIRLVRSRVASVRGRIVAPPDVQVNEVWLERESSGPDLLDWKPRARVGDGQFEIRDVPPGSYQLTATPGSSRRAVVSFDQLSTSGGNVLITVADSGGRIRQPIQVGTADLEGVRLVAESVKRAEVSVRLSSPDLDEAALAQVRVMAADERSAITQGASRIKGLGTLSLEPGRYNLYVGSNGNVVVRSALASGRDVLADGLTITGPGSLVVDMVVSTEAAQISGTAADSDGNPAAGATVVLVPAGGFGIREFLFRDTTTDQLGRFEFQGLRPGDYKLYAWDDVEDGIWLDPDFLKKYASRAEAVTVPAKGHETVHLKLASQ